MQQTVHSTYGIFRPAGVNLIFALTRDSSSAHRSLPFLPCQHSQTIDRVVSPSRDASPSFHAHHLSHWDNFHWQQNTTTTARTSLALQCQRLPPLVLPVILLHQADNCIWCDHSSPKPSYRCICFLFEGSWTIFTPVDFHIIDAVGVEPMFSSVPRFPTHFHSLIHALSYGITDQQSVRLSFRPFANYVVVGGLVVSTYKHKIS